MPDWVFLHDTLTCLHVTSMPILQGKDALNTDEVGGPFLISYLTPNLPRRNVLMALGDFNCSLEACGSHVGTTNFRTDRGLLPGAQHADAGQFLSIVRAHGLVALNSFCPTLGPTFQHGSNCSRIGLFFHAHHPLLMVVPKMSNICMIFLF